MTLHEEHLFPLTANGLDVDGSAHVRPNVWLLSPEEVPPLLFTAEECARLLGMSRGQIYRLMQLKELPSIKVGALRRVSAKALSEYVARLELDEPA